MAGPLVVHASHAAHPSHRTLRVLSRMEMIVVPANAGDGYAAYLEPATLARAGRRGCRDAAASWVEWGRRPS
jgi:hypothetical protein